LISNSATRRRVLKAVGIAGGAVFAPALVRAAAPAQLQFGLTPVFLTNDLELLAKLKSYLSRATGCEVRLIQRRTYQEITTLLLSHQLDAAWICGYPYVRYREQLELLAVPVWQGRPLYQSYIIVSSDRDITSVDALRGDIHAFSDPDSNSGYLVTTALLAKRGVRPPSFFSRTFYTYGHRNVVRAVASGLAQSGSVDGYVWEVLKETEPELTSRTRIFRKSEWLGFPPVAGSSASPTRASGQQLARALVSMNEDPEGQSVLSMLRLNGFAHQKPALFDLIAEKVEQVRRLG
jgi:phosphonate transport system substrate-binding protein